jgi:hypothetical protein
MPSRVNPSLLRLAPVASFANATQSKVEQAAIVWFPASVLLVPSHKNPSRSRKKKEVWDAHPRKPAAMMLVFVWGVQTVVSNANHNYPFRTLYLLTLDSSFTFEDTVTIRLGIRTNHELDTQIRRGLRTPTIHI